MTSVKTEKEWALVARETLRSYPQGLTVGLTGPLGAGKTSLVRALIYELWPREIPQGRVLSPSFVIHQSYCLSRPIEHFDLYRFENLREKELIEIGYFEAVDFAREHKGFVLVEWPEKVNDLSLLQLDQIWNIEVKADARYLKKDCYTPAFNSESTPQVMTPTARNSTI